MMDLRARIIYCLEHGFPAELTSAMLRLVDDADLLEETFDVWVDVDMGDHSDFTGAVYRLTAAHSSFCDDCSDVLWTGQNPLNVCDDCFGNYTYCDCCDSYSNDTTGVGGRTFCENCRDAYCSWCDQCDAYVEDSDEHTHSCDCEAPHIRFEFPNDGHGTVRHNERVAVELPKGTIDDEGMRAITCLLRDTIRVSLDLTAWTRSAMYCFDVDGEVGPVWQTKRGNFTRRLSSALYRQFKFKLPPGVISEVGNIGRAHSSNTSEWNVDFTRNLNGSASDFYHEESCWFTDGSYAASRCALKAWGGLGIRSYDDIGNMTGRAWIQPLDENLVPTHDAIGAHAYVIYNAYGALVSENGEGYVAARIVAHLTGRTYRKIEFSAQPQFVNNDSGYLVADEDTCLNTAQVSYSYDKHHNPAREMAYS